MNIPDYILYMYMKVCLKLREENDSQHTLRKCVSVSGFTRHISVTNETPQTNTPDKRKENNIWRVYKFTIIMVPYQSKLKTTTSNCNQHKQTNQLRLTVVSFIEKRSCCRDKHFHKFRYFSNNSYRTKCSLKNNSKM